MLGAMCLAHDSKAFDEFEENLVSIPFLYGRESLESRYVYEKELGKGAYGCVMCGYRKVDHCSVAIKQIPNDTITEWYYSKTYDKRIPLEIVLMARTSKVDGVVSIIEYCEVPEFSQWFIIMERFTNSVDLFEYISSMGFLDEATASYIFYQLVRAVIECHFLRVVHGDIKEENILINVNTKKIWLIDFGSGCFMNHSSHKTYNGTPEYTPPEWIKFRKYKCCQLESWCLGIVLYSMVFGHIPFESEDEIIANPIRFPRNISKECRDLLLKCLDRDPICRFQPPEMISHSWVKDCFITYNDSGRSSFDEAFLERSDSQKNCLCKCAESAIGNVKDDYTSAIEFVSYNPECIKEIEQFRVFSRSFSPNMNRTKSLCPADVVLSNYDNSKYHRSSISSVAHIDNQYHGSRNKRINMTSFYDLDSNNDLDEDVDNDFEFDEIVDI